MYQTRVGIYFEDESESSNAVDDALVANDIGSEDVSVNVFSVRVEDTMDVEEGAESEQEVVDEEVNDGPGTNAGQAGGYGDGEPTSLPMPTPLPMTEPTSAAGSIPLTMTSRSSHAAGGKGSHGDDGEMVETEVEVASDAGTDLGSLAEIVQEMPADFQDMGQDEYDEYRFEMLAEATGIEHYVMKKLAFHRTCPMTRIVWNVIKQLLNLQKSIQLGGPKMRVRALQYLRDRRRYEEYLDTGRVEPDETVYSSRYPIQWAAAHYGWGADTDDEVGPQPGDYEDGMDGCGESFFLELRLQAQDHR